MLMRWLKKSVTLASELSSCRVVELSPRVELTKVFGALFFGLSLGSGRMSRLQPIWGGQRHGQQNLAFGPMDCGGGTNCQLTSWVFSSPGSDATVEVRPGHQACQD